MTISNHKEETKPKPGIGSTLSFNGELRGDEDLHIDGKVVGSIVIDNHTLTIGSNGQIEADIQAKNVTVKGQIRGHIIAREKVFIHDTARVVGDIAAANISVMEGAQFEGNAKIQKSIPDAKREPAPTERKTDTPLLTEDDIIDV